MSFAQTVRGATDVMAEAGDPRQVVSDAMQQVSGGPGEDGTGLDPSDFMAARDQGTSVGTRIEQKTTSLNNTGEALNRSEYERDRQGPVRGICPMVIPRGRTFVTMSLAMALIGICVLGAFAFLSPQAVSGGAPGNPLLNPFFGIHYWLITVAVTAFMWWRQGMVMVPEGCEAVVTRFGKRENNFSAGR